MQLVGVEPIIVSAVSPSVGVGGRNSNSLLRGRELRLELETCDG